jgi:meso-butanediol dehydrogenase/(S,S)-butanediol dehydrogenase/diacetyl reductase
MDRFNDKVVLVTGAASGIGRATAQRIGAEGGHVFCVDLQAEAAAETAKSICEAGGRATAHACDVSDPEQVTATMAACLSELGRLDALCNVAGVLPPMQTTADVELATWQRSLDVNLTGTFLMCQSALPHLLESKGCIVNTSSTSALRGLPWSAAYAASKGGVLALTYTLAVEYGKQGVRSNAVCPGNIMTPMTSAVRLPEDVDTQLILRTVALDRPRGPEAVAGVIAMLASEDGDHVNGEFIRMDGGALS